MIEKANDNHSYHDECSTYSEWVTYAHLTSPTETVIDNSSRLSSERQVEEVDSKKYHHKLYRAEGLYKLFAKVYGCFPFQQASYCS